MRWSRVGRESTPLPRLSAARGMERPAALVVTALLLLLAQSGGRAQQGATALGELRYFKAYFGNFGHVAGAEGLSGLGDPATGLATGTINISGVPGRSDIAAAFLYWESMTDSADITSDAAAPVAGADITFNGSPIVGKQITPNIGSPATLVPSCYG